MKKTFILMMAILMLSSAAAASDLTDTFSRQFNDLLPPENSSVHSDYLFEQIALSGKYTVMILDRIQQENQNLNAKADKLIEKIDLLIEQNKKMIELLEKKQEKN